MAENTIKSFVIAVLCVALAACGPTPQNADASGDTGAAAAAGGDAAPSAEAAPSEASLREAFVTLRLAKMRDPKWYSDVKAEGDNISWTWFTGGGDEHVPGTLHIESVNVEIADSEMFPYVGKVIFSEHQAYDHFPNPRTATARWGARTKRWNF